jgi:hypothetical protein
MNPNVYICYEGCLICNLWTSCEPQVENRALDFPSILIKIGVFKLDDEDNDDIGGGGGGAGYYIILDHLW